MKFLYGIYRNLLYVFFFLGIVIALPFLLIIAFMFGQNAANKFPCFYAKLLCLLIPMRIEISGKENIDKNQSYVVVMNHRSFMDIVAVYASLDMDIRWVMKKELTKVPFFGYSAVLLGNIPIDRKNTMSALKSINKAREIAKNGTSVAFFPEGTRYNNRVMGPFKKGAFHFALDVGLPVLPVAIIGTDTIMPVHTSKFFPGKIKLYIHPAVETSSYTKVTVNSFSDEVYGVIYSTLEKHKVVNREKNEN